LTVFAANSQPEAMTLNQWSIWEDLTT
jgi:hypothetical protein